MNCIDWDALGVPPGTNKSLVKSAFRQKVKELHPDLHPSDKKAEAELKRLVRAYKLYIDSSIAEKRSDILFSAQRARDISLQNAENASKSPTESWRSVLLKERMERVAHAVILLAMVLAPVFAIILGVAVFGPGLSGLTSAGNCGASSVNCSSRGPAPAVLILDRSSGSVIGVMPGVKTDEGAAE